MAKANRHHQEEVKVVLIDTRYVETDPMSFKFVVQSLTGKESPVTWIKESSFSGAQKGKRALDTEANNGIAGEENSGDGAGGRSGDWRFANGLSFKDLDRMILEVPPMEEWRQLWDQYNL